jgi:hypothetical protein
LGLTVQVPVDVVVYDILEKGMYRSPGPVTHKGGRKIKVSIRDLSAGKYFIKAGNV